ncbi:MAG: YegS/Rv2252/BmrU family lipid kinase [Chloroflexota bacterium]|nr:YegS/Rv2252/BmrU family lipid kinase [Chloroflexota bacterium]
MTLDAASPQRTLIILNPHAGGGQAGRAWRDLEPLLWQQLGELLIAVTERPEEVAQHLDKARAAGITRVIAIGGDGTNHGLINALAHLNARYPDEAPMIYGNLPIGTGRDWARGQGMPHHDPAAAARWIARAQPIPTDIGRLTHEGGAEYFLNIASAGIGAEVVRRVAAVGRRRPWTFLRATVGTIVGGGAVAMQVTLDGAPWFDGRAYVCAIANGSTFGHGMKIAPHADARDGLFEVILVKDVPRLEVLIALQRVFSGTHLTHPAVMSARARIAQVQTVTPIGIELDGELTRAHDMTFTIQPGLLSLLG